MAQVVLCSLLLLASTSALPKACTPTQNETDKMNGLDFMHLTSYCTVQRITEETNTQYSEVQSHILPTRVCSSMKKVKNVNLMFAEKCISQSIRQEGDSFPLDADVITKRIASAAAEFVKNFSNKDKCSNDKLENLSYEEATKKFKNYDHCMYKEFLKNLANAHILTEPKLNFQENNVFDVDYYGDYGFSDPNADYIF